MFRDARRARRALMPVGGFFEWQTINGQKAKRPCAIAMKDGSSFALVAIWETRRDPSTGGTICTFAFCPVLVDRTAMAGQPGGCRVTRRRRLVHRADLRGPGLRADRRTALVDLHNRRGDYAVVARRMRMRALRFRAFARLEHISHHVLRDTCGRREFPSREALYGHRGSHGLQRAKRELQSSREYLAGRLSWKGNRAAGMPN
jgi:hypothetical protein